MKKLILGLIVVLAMAFCFSELALAEKKMVDDFSKRTNTFGGRSSVYQRAPSRALFRKVDLERNGTQDKVLMIKYDKKMSGGPYGRGGWCGYYTILKKGSEYFDATGYTKLTMWVKGETGEENFMVGMADDYWEAIDDSVKSEEIGAYLPSGKITTEWQKAEIPLDAWFVEFSKVFSMSMCFETDLFVDDVKGVVYIDEIAFE